jgi:hypothetical protein
VSLSRSSATSFRITSALRAKSDEAGSMLEWSGMAFARCEVRRDLRRWSLTWCHRAGGLCNQQNGLMRNSQ